MEARERSSPSPLPAEINDVTGAIVDAAYAVHVALGPGLLENVYEVCLAHELTKRRFNVATQVALPVEYDGIRMDAGLRMDMVVNACVVVEIKAVDKLVPIHTAQLLTYLKMSGMRAGLLINFNVERIREGIKRVVL